MVQWGLFMDLSKEVMRKAYKPFWRLAFYNFCVYTLTMLVMIVFFSVLKDIAELEGAYPWDIPIIVYFLLCAKAFRITILSLLEQNIRCFEKVLVKIDMIETDGLFGDYKNSNQEIKKCYAKEVNAERDKLICIDEKGTRLKFRMIGSERKLKIIKRMFLLNDASVYITYGKLTRIIFKFESVEPKKSMNYNNVKMLNNIF